MIRVKDEKKAALPKRPKIVADDLKAIEADTKRASIFLKLDSPLLAQIDIQWHLRQLKSRSETIRVLLAEALR